MNRELSTELLDIVTSASTKYEKEKVLHTLVKITATLLDAAHSQKGATYDVKRIERIAERIVNVDLS